MKLLEQQSVGLDLFVVRNIPWFRRRYPKVGYSHSYSRLFCIIWLKRVLINMKNMALCQYIFEQTFECACFSFVFYIFKPTFKHRLLAFFLNLKITVVQVVLYNPLNL